MIAAPLPERPCRAVELVFRGFESYRLAFDAVTRRARRRFETQDWTGMQSDARERLELYGHVVRQLLAELETLLGDGAREEATWARMRAAFAERTAGHPAVELAETFFNSVTRRVFTTVGVNDAIEFVDFRFARVPVLLDAPPIRAYVSQGETQEAVARLLEDFRFAVPWADAEGDAARVAEAVEAQWAAAGAPLAFEELEMLVPVFFRRKGAYLVGRVRGGERVMPCVLALTHGADGICVDAVLMREEDVSVVFGFTRSYFHAEARRPGDVIAFLSSILPAKPVGELYTAIGHHKHGKTEFWRELQRHLARSDERFVPAAGAPGHVMAVFTLPTLDVVFKVIRDRFPAEKRATPGDVKRRYRFVFQHDRAGRLVDAQEFEHVAFPRDRFTDAVLEELLETAGRTVRVDGDQVIIAHLYSERRVRPLDLYLRSTDPARARRAVLDYGRAIAELAATDVFPGDFLPKNFGVTRHGRVVFYDYDELCTLADCTFRALPEARTPEEAMADEPWFPIGPTDVFPEELVRFVPFKGEDRAAFVAAHGQLFTAGFWQTVQQRCADGEIVDIYPYPESVRLPGRVAP